MVNYYNISEMKTATNFVDLAKGSDVILGGNYFGLFLLIILAFVTFATLKIKNYSTSASFTVTCWLLMIISWLLRTMSLIDNYTLWGTVIVTIISVFILFISNN